MTGAAPVTFRAVTARDLAMIRAWIASPQWQAWWGDPETEIEAIRDAMEDEAVEPLIALQGGQALGYAQVYDPHLEDGHPYADQPFGTLGIDLSIAPERIGTGRGPALLGALAALLFAEGAPRLVIDPHPDNRRAVRAYEKAGFARFDLRDTPFGPALLMALDNPEFAHAPG